MTQDPAAGAPANDELSVRQAEPEDRPAMIELCRTALGWRPQDPSERFFAWKHDENPFGPSPAWIAETADGALAGVRVFMRWEFGRRGDSAPTRAVRAVDTATHPDMQGRGVFTRLTLGALPDLERSGVHDVFNTPNDKSRPGYLKMGWTEVGRVPVKVRLASVRSVPRLRGARVAAEKWSEPTEVGRSAVAALSDRDGVERLLRRCGGGDDRLLRTDRSGDFLRWRYSFDALHYRAVPLGDRTEDGLVLFRLRRRGTALEAAICDVLDPSDRGGRSAIGWVLRRTGADYAIRCGGTSSLDGFVPAPGLGPILTWRPLGGGPVPGLGELDLALGDIELF